MAIVEKRRLKRSAPRRWVGFGTRGGSVVEYVMILGVVAFALIAGLKQAQKRENRVIAQQAAVIRTLDNSPDPDISDFIDPLEFDSFDAPSCTAMGVCTAPGKCFAAGTLVATEEGLRPIEAVHVGERVWSRDEVSGAVDLRPVLERFVTPAQAVLDLSFASADGGEIIRATSGHPFWVTGRGWVPAAQLSVSEPLWSSSGEPIHLAFATPSERSYETVYNFNIGEYHTYFVGRHGVWVHNGGPKPPSGVPPGTNPCQAGGTNPTKPSLSAAIRWKAFSKGKLAEHYAKHVVKRGEFGPISQNEYERRAKAFASESGNGFQEERVGNFIVKYDPETRRVFIGHAGDREIRTFYIADPTTEDPFEEAKETARNKAI